jgi:hypothetical protein
MAHRPAAPAASEFQPTLFHGSLNFDYELRNELGRAIEDAKMPRRDIALRMADLTASRVTEAMLDAWTAPSRVKWNLPVRLAVAFDSVTNSSCILELLARKAGRKVITPAEALDSELGQLARQEAEIHRRRAALLAALQVTRAAR